MGFLKEFEVEVFLEVKTYRGPLWGVIILTKPFELAHGFPQRI